MRVTGGEGIGRIFRGLLAAAILMAVAASARAADPDDARLKEKILGRLSGQVALHLEQFELQVEGGAVRMGGSVASLAEIQRLERIVLSVPGVTGMESSITVRPYDRPEPLLEGEVRRMLERRPRFRAAGLQIAAAGSVVTLSGRVDRAIDRLEAGELAGEVPGVTQVNNQIVTTPSTAIDEETIRKRVVALLGNPLGFGVIRELHVEVAGARVTLKGSVARELDRREAERLALTVEGVESIQNELTVTPR